ncbi:hypothetical protein EC968_008797, partial [Mortierella alpina]
SFNERCKITKDTLIQPGLVGYVGQPPTDCRSSAYFAHNLLKNLECGTKPIMTTAGAAIPWGSPLLWLALANLCSVNDITFSAAAPPEQSEDALKKEEKLFRKMALKDRMRAPDGLYDIALDLLREEYQLSAVMLDIRRLNHLFSNGNNEMLSILISTITEDKANSCRNEAMELQEADSSGADVAAEEDDDEAHRTCRAPSKKSFGKTCLVSSRASLTFVDEETVRLHDYSIEGDRGRDLTKKKGIGDQNQDESTVSKWDIAAMELGYFHQQAKNEADKCNQELETLQADIDKQQEVYNSSHRKQILTKRQLQHTIET